MKKKLYNISPKTVRPSLREYVDFDYINKLSDEEKAWLDEFSRGYYMADLKKSTIFTDPEEKKELFRANNARTRDVYNKQRRSELKASGEMSDGLVDYDFEDRMIAKLDGELPHEDDTE